MDRNPAAALFAAFADPTRLRILLFLHEGALCVGDLVELLGVPQPTASRQLASLREAGLVTADKRGLWVFYALAEPANALHGALLDALVHCADLSRELLRDASAATSLRRTGGCCPAESGATGGPSGCGESAKGPRATLATTKSATTKRTSARKTR